jgi:hypothetical protein
MVAVLVVSGVGSIVDYRKEIEFVLRRNNADKTKLVSKLNYILSSLRHVY